MSNSDYTLSFEDRGTYLYAYLTGRDSFVASLSYWNEIIKKVTELGYSKLLVHENLTGEVSEGEMFEIVTNLLKSGHGISAAFFDENASDEAINALGELVAGNRGIQIQIFKTLDAARQWTESAA